MYQFNVPDMSCGHCVKTITSAISSQDAAASVQCDLARHQVTVETQLSASTVRQLLNEAGYPPTE